jgi:hypothetical protein
MFFFISYITSLGEKKVYGGINPNPHWGFENGKRIYYIIIPAFTMSFGSVFIT